MDEASRIKKGRRIKRWRHGTSALSWTGRRVDAGNSCGPAYASSRPTVAGPASNPETATHRLSLNRPYGGRAADLAEMTFLFDVLIYAVAWTHVLIAPYTKVEESFTLHALHDLLLYGGSPDALPKVRFKVRNRVSSSNEPILAQFDHKVFSGAIPRSFVGSIAVAWLSNYIARLANDLSLITSKFDLQIVSSYFLAQCPA
jgi:hypothetical protein